MMLLVCRMGVQSSQCPMIDLRSSRTGMPLVAVRLRQTRIRHP